MIGAYWPINGEFDPQPALHRWKEDGELVEASEPRRIGLPVVDKVHKTLTFCAWWPGCPMEDDAYSIPKPKDTEIIVPDPAVRAVRRVWNRRVSGSATAAVFYDRTLATLQPRPFTVGLGFKEGFIDELEPEAHDLPLDAIPERQRGGLADLMASRGAGKRHRPSEAKTGR